MDVKGLKRENEHGVHVRHRDAQHNSKRAIPRRRLPQTTISDSLVLQTRERVDQEDEVVMLLLHRQLAAVLQAEDAIEELQEARQI